MGTNAITRGHGDNCLLCLGEVPDCPGQVKPTAFETGGLVDYKQLDQGLHAHLKVSNTYIVEMYSMHN